MADKVDKLMAEGLAARREHRLADARNAFAQALTLSREAEDPSKVAQALTGLGQIERDLGNNDAALRNYQDAVAMYRQQNEPLRLAHTVRHMADILRHCGRLRESEQHYSEALHIYRSHVETSSLDLANALRGFALLTSELGEVAKSKTLWTEARALYASTEVQAGVDESDTQIARLRAKSV
jgi:tetratricopeptide (TPR) repeat protein